MGSAAPRLRQARAAPWSPMVIATRRRAPRRRTARLRSRGRRHLACNDVFPRFRVLVDHNNHALHTSQHWQPFDIMHNKNTCTSQAQLQFQSPQKKKRRMADVPGVAAPVRKTPLYVGLCPRLPLPHAAPTSSFSSSPCAGGQGVSALQCLLGGCSLLGLFSPLPLGLLGFPTPTFDARARALDPQHGGTPSPLRVEAVMCSCLLALRVAERGKGGLAGGGAGAVEVWLCG